MSAIATTSPVASIDSFKSGPFTTVLCKIESASSTCRRRCGESELSSDSDLPPKSLLIASPISGDHQDAEFPVLMLLHGFLLYNSFYTQLMEHVASHGFIVVAPQLYIVAGPDCTDEINSTAEITTWLTKGLKHYLPEKIQPNLNKLAISGHSRGGKVAFALAGRNTSCKFSALIGIDPVDGMDKGIQTPPPVLTYEPKSFNIGMPVMVIGSGLGALRRNALFPPCAPSGVNHKDFYDECRPPSCYFVAKDYGHLDMLDDKTDGIRGRVNYCLCKNGKEREAMRRFVGGVIVVFLKSYLDGDFGELMLLKDGLHTRLPLELQNVDFCLV